MQPFLFEENDIKKSPTVRIGTVGDFVRSHALQQMIKGNLLSRYSKLFLHLNQRYCAVVVCSVQCQCKPNAERVKLACMSYAEVQPDLAKQSKNTSIELYKIILNTYLYV